MSTQKVRGKELSKTDISQYRGKWLALEPKRRIIVAHADTLRESKQAAIKKGIVDPVMMEIPESGLPFGGYTIVNHSQD